MVASTSSLLLFLDSFLLLKLINLYLPSNKYSFSKISQIICEVISLPELSANFCTDWLNWIWAPLGRKILWSCSSNQAEPAFPDCEFTRIIAS